MRISSIRPILYLASLAMLAACGTAPTLGGAPTTESGNAAGIPGQAVTAVPAPSIGTVAPGLSGVTWQWQQTELTDGSMVKSSDPARYTIRFESDGMIAIRSDCNSVGGTYTQADTLLSLELGPTTLVGCPPDSQESVFNEYLSQVVSWRMMGDNLILALEADKGSMQFRQEPLVAQSPLIGTLWQWVAHMSGETAMAIGQPERYTIQFLEDGTMAIQADCNEVSGRYSTNGESIKIELGASTKVACPADSEAPVMLMRLVDTTAFSIEGNNLTLVLGDKREAMEFMAQ